MKNLKYFTKTISGITLSVALALPAVGLTIEKPISEKGAPLQYTLQKSFVGESTTRSNLVQSMHNRLEYLEEKLDNFEADVTDGPSSNVDKMLEKRIKKLSNTKEEVEDHIEKLEDSSDFSEWNNRKVKAQESLDSFSNEVFTLIENNINVR